MGDTMATRVHIVLPGETLVELDQTVGKRHRSEFVAEAVREKLLRLRHVRAVQEAISTLPSDEIPGWNSPEEVSAWLRDSRQRDVERLKQESHWSEA